MKLCMHKNWLQKDVECFTVEVKSLICEKFAFRWKKKKATRYTQLMVSRFRF